MRVRRWLILSALAASLLVRGAAAAEFEEKRFHLIPFLGRTFFDDDRRFLTGERLHDNVYYGGRLNARLSRLFLIEVAGGVTPTETCCDWVDWGHISGNLMWSPATTDRISPFVSLGGGWSRSEHSTGLTQDLGTYEGAAGFNVKLSDDIGLRFEARDVLASSPDHFNEVILGMGLNIGFGDYGEEAEEVAVVETVPAPCPDADRDGVCDDADQCPDTRAGCRVDAVGCPIDSDHDGVCDGLDRCPDTPAGAQVDADGCPIAAPSQLETQMMDKGVIAVRDIYFDTGSWDIKPESNQTLNELCTIFKQWPALQIEIGGHADSRGGDAYNQELTEKRAEAVLDWMRANCSEANLANFTAQGYGEGRPVGSNRTSQGMALNRRIEFKVLNPEMLKRSR